MKYKLSPIVSFEQKKFEIYSNLSYCLQCFKISIVKTNGHIRVNYIYLLSLKRYSFCILFFLKLILNTYQFSHFNDLIQQLSKYTTINYNTLSKYKYYLFIFFESIFFIIILLVQCLNNKYILVVFFYIFLYIYRRNNVSEIIFFLYQSRRNPSQVRSILPTSHAQNWQ